MRRRIGIRAADRRMQPPHAEYRELCRFRRWNRDECWDEYRSEVGADWLNALYDAERSAQ